LRVCHDHQPGIRVLFETLIQGFCAALVQACPLKGDVKPFGGLASRQELLESLLKPFQGA
jgi:hypothetical protein